MPRRIYSAAVVVFFLVMMVSLTRREILPSLRRSAGIDVDRRVLVDSWVNQDDFSYLFLDRSRVGAIRNTAEEILADDSGDVTVGYTTTSHIELRWLVLRGRVIVSTRLDRRLELQSARVRVHLPTIGVPLYTPEQLDAPELPRGAYEAAALVEGRTMNLRLRRDDAIQFREFDLAQPVTMADSLTPVLRGQMLTRDVTYSVDVFDPLMGGAAGQAQLEWIDSDEKVDENGVKQTYKKVELRFGSSRTLLTVDPTGTVIRREIPLVAGAQQQASGGGLLGASKLVMDRQEPTIAMAEFPALVYVPEPPDYLPEDFRGEDRGQVLDFSAFGAMAASIATQSSAIPIP